MSARRPSAAEPATAGNGPASHQSGAMDAEEPHRPEDAQADFAPLAPGEAAGQGRLEVAEGQQASLRAKEHFDRAVAAAKAGDEQAALDDYVAAASIAEGAHEWHLAAVSCERVGDSLLSPHPPYDLERALRMYRRSSAAYEHCGLFAEAREMAYRVLLIRQQRAGELGLTPIQRIESFLYWLTAGFGFRPLRVVGTAGVTIVFYTLWYWLIGGAIEERTGRAATLAESLYFSGITFATVGYGDFIPAPHARLIALTEGFCGAFLMGFFVVVLFHRLARP